MSHVLPWELSVALQQDRLITLARVAVETRNRAFAEADRAAGDTNWGLGCKAHERLAFALGRLAESDGQPWLTVIRDGLYLMPIIENVPVRLYRGSADRPGARNLDAVRLEAERVQVPDSQIAFSFMAPSADEGQWYWLMAMETDALGMVTRVVYFQANDAGETRHPWECPLTIALPKPEATPAVELAALAEPSPIVHEDAPLWTLVPVAPHAAPNPDPAELAPLAMEPQAARDAGPGPLTMGSQAAEPALSVPPANHEQAIPVTMGGDPAVTTLEPVPAAEPRKRATRRARSAAPVVDPRQADLWGAALGGE